MVDVSYGSGKTARFVNQIIVSPGSFLAAGDSGSLMVEDVATAPRAVGLLFAGSSSVAIANPIQPFLMSLWSDPIPRPISSGRQSHGYRRWCGWPKAKRPVNSFQDRLTLLR